MSMKYLEHPSFDRGQGLLDLEYDDTFFHMILKLLNNTAERQHLHDDIALWGMNPFRLFSKGRLRIFAATYNSQKPSSSAVVHKSEGPPFLESF